MSHRPNKPVSLSVMAFKRSFVGHITGTPWEYYIICNPILNTSFFHTSASESLFFKRVGKAGG